MFANTPITFDDDFVVTHLDPEGMTAWRMRADLSLAVGQPRNLPSVSNRWLPEAPPSEYGYAVERRRYASHAARLRRVQAYKAAAGFAHLT